ncbi:UNVERIFIED_CONTAM: hypothetical protein NCL1_02916 [Trichonephila clavipes]
MGGLGRLMAQREIAAAMVRRQHRLGRAGLHAGPDAGRTRADPRAWCAAAGGRVDEHGGGGGGRLYLHRP